MDGRTFLLPGGWYDHEVTDEEVVAEALAAIQEADREIERANDEAREIQRRAGDARALAVARLVDVAGRQGAADLLVVSLKAIDKATGRARALAKAREE